MAQRASIALLPLREAGARTDAVDGLAYNLVTATGRNCLHTWGQELRAEAGAT